MPEFTVELARIHVHPDIVAAIRLELESAGLNFGRLVIGDVISSPGTLYFLWWSEGETPICHMYPWRIMVDAPNARRAARAFFAKWEERSG